MAGIGEIEQSGCGNILLASLQPEDFALIAPHLDRVPLGFDEVVAVAGRPIDSACFPEDGVVSFAERLEDGGRVGVGMIGREGLVGWPVLFDGERSPHEASVAVGGGSAMRIGADLLRQACQESSGLNAQLLRFVQTFIVQLSRTLVSNLCDPVEHRLARWLLMNHDRLEGDEIALTHDQIGEMLGIRRASVTDNLHILEGEGLVRCTRGRILIRDRCGLRRLAGQAYGFAEAEYSRMIAPFGKENRQP